MSGMVAWPAEGEPVTDFVSQICIRRKRFYVVRVQADALIEPTALARSIVSHPYGATPFDHSERLACRRDSTKPPRMQRTAHESLSCGTFHSFLVSHDGLSSARTRRLRHQRTRFRRMNHAAVLMALNPLLWAPALPSVLASCLGRDGRLLPASARAEAFPWPDCRQWLSRLVGGMDVATWAPALVCVWDDSAASTLANHRPFYHASAAV